MNLYILLIILSIIIYTMVLALNKKFKLIVCELFHPFIHGYIPNISDPAVQGHYLVITSKKENVQEMVELYQENYEFVIETSDLINRPHPLIRNYANIIQAPHYIKPEIGEMIELSGQERVAILKTFWIRIIQRTWKKIYMKRKQVIHERMNPKTLFQFQKTGKWPQSCSYLPSINGLLL